jgi:beta-galactosidase
MYHKPTRVRFGAAYYHEYQQVDRLETDLDLMTEASFSVIRVGESVWSTWEPQNGTFNLEWLLPVLDGAHERGIGVVLGTPTYAVPPWLARIYPEIAGERATGQRISWGARQEVDFTHPAFRFHAERVVRQILGRYAAHPAVIGVQVDNEPGNELLHNHGVFQRFVDWLRERYGDVETLNEAWGLVYWSHRLSTWADLWIPDGNAQPQYDLAWRQFQAQQTTEFIAWQAGLAREYVSADQFVTTCMAYDVPAFDDRTMAASLDVAAGNAYYTMQGGLALPDSSHIEQNWRTSGTWSLYLSADRMYSSKQAPFVVTETNAQSIARSFDNRPAYDGQWRQGAWALVSRGAEMIEYWHWHTLQFGTETYWGGVLPHSGLPGRAYREIAQLGREFERAGDAVTGLVPDAEVTFVYSAASRWALQAQPPLATGNGSPDQRSYQGIVEPFYRGAFDAKLQARIVHAEHLFTPDSSPQSAAVEHPNLVAAGLYVTSDRDLDWLLEYAESGGHLILGPRTAYADDEARARTEVAPARLHEAAGVWYDEYSNIGPDLAVVASPQPPGGLPALALGTGATATRWVDGLVATTAAVLATYEDRHFSRWPAITTHAHGAGRITVVGTVPSLDLAEQLFRWIDDLRAAVNPWRPQFEAVTVTSATNGRGERIHFTHNWSWENATLTIPAPAVDVLTQEELPVGHPLQLEPWDVRVLKEACPSED